MNGYITLLLIFCFVALFVFAIWTLIIYFSEKKKPKDETIAIDFGAHINGGHFVGTEVSVKQAKGGRHFIEFLPKDVDVTKDDFKVESEQKIVDSNKIVPLPKGAASPERHINIYMPKRASDMHEALKESLLGKGIMIAVEMQNSVNAEIHSLTEGHLRKDEILQRIGHGEVSKEWMTMITEIYRDTLKSSLEAKGKDKTPTVLNPSALSQPRNE